MESNHDLEAEDSGLGAENNNNNRKKPKKVDQAIVDQIMEGLRDGQPRKTLEIAKFCGFQTKQEVNPTLYYMQKQRLLAKVRRTTFSVSRFMRPLHCWIITLVKKTFHLSLKIRYLIPLLRGN